MAECSHQSPEVDQQIPEKKWELWREPNARYVTEGESDRGSKPPSQDSVYIKHTMEWTGQEPEPGKIIQIIPSQ